MVWVEERRGVCVGAWSEVCTLFVCQAFGSVQITAMIHTHSRFADKSPALSADYAPFLPPYFQQVG